MFAVNTNTSTIGIEVIRFTVIIGKNFLFKTVIFMPILEQIISGGQTGADRAALDTAIKFNIPHGGWISRGRRTEEGPLSDKYRLREMASGDYPSRTRQNILDSDGTAIIARGPLTGGSKLTHTAARLAGRSVCRIDLMTQDIFEAALILHSFVVENHLKVLNVAGPRASHDPAIYFDVKSVMESMLYLIYLDKETETDPETDWPAVSAMGDARDLDQAVEWITSDLSLKAKTRVGRMADSRVDEIYFSMLDYIKVRTGLDRENSRLFKYLGKGRDLLEYTPEDGAMDIVKALKSHLARNHNLRILH